MPDCLQWQQNAWHIMTLHEDQMDIELGITSEDLAGYEEVELE